MSIHAVDLVCSKDSNVAFVGSPSSFVNVWLTNYTAWEPDGDLTQSNDPPTLANTKLDGSGTDYYRGGIWRFAWSEDKSILLDNLTGQADAYCPWYRIRWHECFHDEAGACSWDETRSSGTIPEGV